MERTSKNFSKVTWAIGGAALGALGMFLLDPDQGNRRRALAKDKMNSASVKTKDTFSATSRDLANRAQGLRAEATRVLSKVRRSGDTSTDQVSANNVTATPATPITEDQVTKSQVI